MLEAMLSGLLMLILCFIGISLIVVILALIIIWLTAENPFIAAAVLILVAWVELHCG